MDLKNQAFLVFKNAFKRRFLLCKPKFPEDPLKNEIKSKLIEYMQLLKMNSFLSKSIKSCILDLVETEFPLSYKALVFYLKNGFEQLSTRINENPMSFMDSQSLTFLKEVHRIFKTRRQAKNFQKIPETQFREFFESILQSSYSIMTLISNNFENAKSNPKPDIIISFLTVSQLNDEICLMILQYINTDSHLDEIFKTIVELMFQKCSILIQTLLEDPKKLPNEMKKLLNKNLKGILYNFSKLQNGLPFLFFPHLQQYVELIKFILDNNHSFSDERILKSGLIAFYKLLKTFAYFADSQSYSRSLRKTEKDIQEKINFQLNVLQNINTLFTDQTLEQLLFSILQNILIREFNKQKNEENLENLIELGLYFCFLIKILII